MIINGTHIQGVFKYFDNLEYERGDFVIEDDVIYICIAESPTNDSTKGVKGQLPSKNPENFKIYLGERIVTASEYFNYINDSSELEDKYVNAASLSAIMSQYMFGLDQKGVISEYIIYNEGNGIVLSPTLQNILSTGISEDGILGEILQSTSLNSALLSLSPELPELIPLFGEEIKNRVILRQFTYSTDNGNVRIQALIYPETGKMLWRSTFPGDWSTVSTWKSTFYDDNVKKDLDNLFGYYQRKIAELERDRQRLKGTWRHKSLKFSRAASVDIQCESSTGTGYLDVPSGSFKKGTEEEVFSRGLDDKLVIQVCLRKQVSTTSNTYWKSWTATIDLLDTICGEVETYAVGDLTLRVSVVNDNRIRLAASTNDGTNCVIYSIYYKNSYE